MRLLCIDTTSVAGSVALAEGERLIAQEQQGVGGTHSERLLATVHHLLAIAKWELASLEGIAVAVGPGSFTGLRIGLATAKGMGLAAGLPVAGASSLAMLAQNGRGFDGTVVPLIDARRGELYAAAWTVDDAGVMRAVLPEHVAPPEEIARELKRLKGRLLLVGDGAAACGAELAEALGRRAVLARGTQLWPQAVNLAILVHGRLERGEGDDLAALIPNYIRHSDAEIGFLGKGKAAAKHERGGKR